MVSRRGGVLLRPIQITFALPDHKGRAEPCPYEMIIVLYNHVFRFHTG